MAAFEDVGSGMAACAVVEGKIFCCKICHFLLETPVVTECDFIKL